MAEENKILIQVELDQRNAQKRAIELTSTIAKQRAELKNYRKILKDSNGENKEAAKQVAILSQEIKQNSADLRANQKEMNASNNSTEALRIETARMQKEQNKLNTSTEAGAKRFKELEAQLKKNREQLNTNSKAAGSFKDNIGNYTASIQEAIGLNSQFAEGLGGMVDGLRGATSASQVLKIAFASLGIGLVVAALSAFFTQTKRGQLLLERFAFVAKSVFGGLAKQLGDAVGGLIDFVSSIDSASDLFDKLGKSISEFSFESLVEGTTKFADELQRAAKQADRLAQRNQEIRNQNFELEKQASIQQRIAEENRKAFDDQRLSFAERLEAVNRAEAAERERARLLVQIADQQVEAIKNEALAQKKSIRDNLETRRQVLDLEKEIEETREDFASRTTELQNERFALRKEQLQTEINLERAKLEEQLILGTKTAEELFRIKLSILDKEKEAELVGIKENSDQALLIEQEFLNKRLSLRKEFGEALKEAIKETDPLRSDPSEAQEVADLAFDQLKENLAREVQAQTSAEAQKQEAIKKTDAVRAQGLSAAKEITGGLIKLLGEQSAAGKAAFLFDKAFAIADVIVKTNQANALLSAQLGIAAAPAIVANTARGAVSVATIAAQTTKGFAGGGVVDELTGKEAPSKSFAKGGSTGNGGRLQPAGVVHGGEFVVSSPVVNSLGGVNNVARLTGQPVNGFANGGVVGRQSLSNQRSINASRGIEQALANMNVQVAVTDIKKATNRFDKIQSRVNA